MRKNKRAHSRVSKVESQWSEPEHQKGSIDQVSWWWCPLLNGKKELVMSTYKNLRLLSHVCWRRLGYELNHLLHTRTFWRSVGLCQGAWKRRQKTWRRWRRGGETQMVTSCSTELDGSLVSSHFMFIDNDLFILMGWPQIWMCLRRSWGTRLRVSSSNQHMLAMTWNWVWWPNCSQVLFLIRWWELTDPRGESWLVKVSRRVSINVVIVVRRDAIFFHELQWFWSGWSSRWFIPKIISMSSRDHCIAYIPILWLFASLHASCYCFSHWAPDKPDSVVCVFSLFSLKTCLHDSSFRYQKLRQEKCDLLIPPLQDFAWPFHIIWALKDINNEVEKLTDEKCAIIEPV